MSPAHSAIASDTAEQWSPLLPAWLEVQALACSHPGWQLCQDWSYRWSAGLALIVGDEGCGKTTLLQVLAGEHPPEAGQVFHRGQPWVTKASDVFWRDPRQPLTAEEQQTTGEAIVASLRSRYPRWDEAQWQAHVQGWALSAQLGKPLLALSTGTLRKLWMAAALSSGAALTLLDEPLAALDLPSIRYLQSALQRYAGSPDRLVLVANYDAIAPVRWDDILQLPLTA